MPPIRTPAQPLTKSIKTSVPVKTERSHEENQERAYIAASRRSDRSLEARVESARRASEIHKKRTGRSLRVTEQDVINEEMYEEEDDDLPLQYRRLTAHLQTNSSDFNRRLSAYLTSHQAMRNALSQALSSSYAQSADQSSQPGQAAHQQQQQQWMSQQNQPFTLSMPSIENNSPSSPTAHRSATANWAQSQYSMTSAPSFTHQRSASFATPSATSDQSDVTMAERSASAIRALKLANGCDMKQTSANTVFPQPAGDPIWDQSNDLGPFATDLSNDARMFLDHQSLSSQYVAPDSFSKPSAHPSFSGIDQTLAPSALDTASEESSWGAPPSASTDNFASGDYSYGQDMHNSIGIHGSSQPATPGDEMWAFIDNSAFEDACS